MKMWTFARRNTKEILRDPLTFCFSLGFPLVILVLLTAIQANIPVSLFELPHIAPGIAVFGLSFMTLFSATLISKDRESALLSRLYTTPMKASDFILGYMVPMIPISMSQSLICFAAALVLGMDIRLNLLWCILMIGPISLLYIGMGLLFGSLLGSKQVGGICGALLTNLAAFLSGTWFDLDMVGGAFQTVAYALPFVHGVELERNLLAGNFMASLPHLAWVLGYALVLNALAIFLFLRQMKK